MFFLFFYTINAEILTRSLVNFRFQQPDRHMNLSFVGCVYEREQTISGHVAALVRSHMNSLLPWRVQWYKQQKQCPQPQSNSSCYNDKTIAAYDSCYISDNLTICYHKTQIILTERWHERESLSFPLSKRSCHLFLFFCIFALLAMCQRCLFCLGSLISLTGASLSPPSHLQACVSRLDLVRFTMCMEILVYEPFSFFHCIVSHMVVSHTYFRSRHP